MTNYTSAEAYGTTPNTRLKYIAVISEKQTGLRNYSLWKMSSSSAPPTRIKPRMVCSGLK